MAAIDGLNGYFKDIDSLQHAAFKKIGEITHLKEEDSNAGESLDDTRSALAKSANLLLNKIADLLVVIEVEILQLSSATVERELLAEKLALYKDKLPYLKKKFRESQLAAFERENEIVHEQRIRKYGRQVEGTKEDLFAGRSKKGNGPDERPVEDQILTQNKNITASLKQTKQLMTMSVMQTELNIDTVDQQTKDLSQLNDKLIDLEGVLVRSRQIVKFIEQQDKKDKRRIYMAIGFLVLCSAWVAWRRIFKLPVKILLWTMFKFFGVFNWVVSKQASGEVSAPASFETAIQEFATTLLSAADELTSLWTEVETSTSTESFNTDEPYVQDIGEEPAETWVGDIVSTATTVSDEPLQEEVYDEDAADIQREETHIEPAQEEQVATEVLSSSVPDEQAEQHTELELETRAEDSAETQEPIEERPHETPEPIEVVLEDAIVPEEVPQVENHIPEPQETYEPAVVQEFAEPEVALESIADEPNFVEDIPPTDEKLEVLEHIDAEREEVTLVTEEEASATPETQVEESSFEADSETNQFSSALGELLSTAFEVLASQDVSQDAASVENAETAGEQEITVSEAELVQSEPTSVETPEAIPTAETVSEEVASETSVGGQQSSTQPITHDEF